MVAGPDESSEKGKTMLVAIGFTWAGGHRDGVWVTKQALELADGYDDSRDGDIALVAPILDRPLTDHQAEVTPEEQAALLRILEDAQDYWVNCDYATDSESEDDRLLGRLADAGLVVSFGKPL